jgi:hypothetical protein
MQARGASTLASIFWRTVEISIYAAAAYLIASTGIALAAAGSALPQGVAAICGLCSDSLRYSGMPIRGDIPRPLWRRDPSCDCDAGLIAR